MLRPYFSTRRRGCRGTYKFFSMTVLCLVNHDGDSLKSIHVDMGLHVVSMTQGFVCHFQFLTLSGFDNF